MGSKMLTNTHKQNVWLSVKYGGGLFKHIITEDEIWIFYTNVESNQQSMQ